MIFALPKIYIYALEKLFWSVFSKTLRQMCNVWTVNDKLQK